MPRTKRRWISQEYGSFHIISRIVDRNGLFTIAEKDYFLALIERLAIGFFIRIHAFCIMGNHFHILATGMESEAQVATKEELFRRYKLMYGKEAEPPQGSYDSCGNIIPDDDEGIERLRSRLGSVSRFVQELKQAFSRWYNKRHERKGYLWGGRYKGVIVYHGEAQLICSSYIDLNPVRAGIVNLPGDYRWSSLGMRLRSPVRAGKLLCPITLVDAIEGSEEVYGLPYVRVTKELMGVEWYRQFVHVSGGIEQGVEIESDVMKRVIKEVVGCNGHLGIMGRLRWRVKNFSGGIAIGGYSAIASIQKTENRKYIRPRLFLDTYWAYSTRVLRL
jgi:REP element-mobilizing transposase RayT